MGDYFILGASGAVGYPLHRLIQGRPHSCVSTYRTRQFHGGVLADTDTTTGRLALVDLVKADPPRYLIITAAKTHVDWCEKHETEAYKLNVLDLKELIGDIRESLGDEQFKNTLIVYLSSGYVFDGKKDGPYTEEDTPNPVNVYGRHKLEMEQYFQETCPDHSLILRTLGVYGPEAWPNKNCLARFWSKTITDATVEISDPESMISVAYGPSLARSIFYLSGKMQTGIWNVASYPPMKKIDFFKAAASLFRPDDASPVNVVGVPCAGVGAPRPMNASLSLDKLSHSISCDGFAYDEDMNKDLEVYKRWLLLQFRGYR